MTDQTCVQCRHYYEFYRVRAEVADCPKCGARGGMDAPLTQEQYLRSMGVEPAPPKGLNRV